MQSPRLPAKLPGRHPLRAAQWIWPEAYMYLYNHYAQFRRDFELAKVPAKAPFYITADKAYRLYVNGQYVCRGPARGYLDHWPFDEVDLKPYLTAGHNWIAVEGYTPGISTFQYLHLTKAGLLCAARWGRFELVSEPQNWIMRRSPAQAVHTARLSVQMDFQEHMAARFDDRSWITSPQPPAGWQAAIFDPQHGHNLMSTPFGQPPYDSVEPRGIPLLREEVRHPVAVTAHGEGACGEGYQTWQNVSWGWVREGRQVTAWGDGREVAATVRDNALELMVAPTGPGRWRAITLDLGEYAVATLRVEAAGAAGGEILDFQTYQCLRDGKPAFVEPGGGCLAAMANRLRLAPGATRHEFFHLLGGRHVTLIARDLLQPLTVRLQYRTAGYPFAMRGRFTCSDDTLTGIHAICRRTQQLCSLDAYVDTPWREQAQWWGDARVQARNTFYLDGDARLLARGIRSVAGQRGPHGLTYGHAPTSSGWCILPDFSLTWILTVWDHYWQTGSLAVFKEQWPRIRDVLGYFQTREARAANGLLRHDGRLWLFEDWSTLYKGEVPTFLNLWYLLTLRQLAILLAAAGKPAAADRLRQQAATQERQCMELLFSAADQAFIAGLDASGAPAADAPSVHDQALALMLDLAPAAHPAMIRNHLLPYLAGDPVPGAKPSAFWAAYVLDEMGRRGYAAACAAFIRRHWAPMLATGTTWEDFRWQEDSGSSCCHAWTAHPSWLFVNQLAGLRQTAAGWTAITVAPQAIPGLDHAEALVPSPQGDIAIAWQRDGTQVRGTLTLPPGVTATLELPGHQTILDQPGTHPFEFAP
ncbi:MAG: alpha-L-rhamnosidase C-terminal domain-containing protein [Lentisphaeria bacterium]